MNKNLNFTRRNFLSRGLTGFGVAAAACAAPHAALAGLAAPPRSSICGAHGRTLSFHNLHTDEKLHITYWREGKYDRAAWGKINHVLRDHYSNQTHVIDLRLLDLLHDLRARLDHDRPIEIISGYRSPATNRELAERSGGVAKNSFHMQGKAADIRFSGVALPLLHNVALKMDRGGVGYYPDSQFVHVDVGPKDRKWG